MVVWDCSTRTGGFGGRGAHAARTTNTRQTDARIELSMRRTDARSATTAGLIDGPAVRAPADSVVPLCVSWQSKVHAALRTLRERTKLSRCGFLPSRGSMRVARRAFGL